MLKRKKLWISILVTLLLFMGTGLYILQQSTFNIIEQSVEIDSPQGKLTGTLALPKKYTGKLGLVLFIHGDGAIDAAHSEGYKPLWEALAAQGYASLSLNKRGINGSEGNWLDQSMDDRVVEAQQALAWAKRQPMIDDTKTGVWGASQAGWVIPKLAGKEKLAFSILVSPAINWRTQGEYNTRSQMKKDGYSTEEIEKQVAYENEIKALLDKKGSYEEYAKLARKDDVMSKERWNFVVKNFNADATVDLANFKAPVLLMLGQDDVNVDIKETEQVYRAKISPESLLHVKVFPNTEHSMLPTSIAGSEWKTTLTFLFAPRSITADGYMEEITQFLGKLKP
jgi:dipeptidyl aminopeptidase/acylaminoacyl peptidase